ncbi:MFS transporter [Paraburkholderia sp. RL17-337-BIB-A]|uniref:MFS transporter n=1 Tax=Paraburkholderia sp. RL17-337-BIB-A TaxID=3031636 RepID=UPI0038BCC220
MGKYRWVIAALLFAASIIAFIDRAALSVAAPFVRADLHLSPAQMGTIFSAFFGGYALFCFVGGWASDRFGPKRTYAVSMLVWSVFCGLTATASSFTTLLILRIFFGVGEGPMGAVTNKTARNWFPPRETGIVMGLSPTGGNMVGAAFASPLVAALAIAFGWRMAFIVIMLLGLIWLSAWLWLMKDRPALSRRVGEAERQYIEAERGEATADTREVMPLGYYLRSPLVLGIAFAFFASNYILYFFLSWLPSYLVDVRHLDIRSMSIIGSIPWMMGLPGCALGGVFSDRLLTRTGNPMFARKIIVVGGLLIGAVLLALSTQVTTTGAAVTLIAAITFLNATTPLACWALVQELVPSRRVGAVGGYVHFLSNLSGIIGPAATGYIIQYGGGYGASFVMASMVAAVAALVVCFFVRSPRTATLRPVEQG